MMPPDLPPLDKADFGATIRAVLHISYMVLFNNPVRVDPLLVDAGNGIIGG